MNLIKDLKVTNNTITVVAHPDFTNNYLREDFFVSYTGEHSHISDNAFALIPFLANVAPIIWLSDLHVTVPKLDSTFIDSLEAIRKVHKEMYPTLSWQGSIKAKETVTSKNSTQKSTESAMLFSGGVDSIYTALYASGDPKTLITVLGSDIARENRQGWHNVQQQTKDFARLYNYKNLYVDSNFRKFLNIPKLEEAWPEIVDGWWGGVQHGIGLLGLTAPVVQQKKMFIAATHTQGFAHSWGSNPKLDTSCKWDSVTVDHHGYNASRQQKILKIIDKSNSKSKPQLRVCYSNAHGKGNNCMRCEKCLRTFTGLLIAGADPKEYGMMLPTVKGTKRVRNKFLTLRMSLGEDEKFMWQDMQKYAQKALKERRLTDGSLTIFFKWLAQLNIDDYYKRSLKIRRMRQNLIRKIRNNPKLEVSIKRIIAMRNN